MYIPPHFQGPDTAALWDFVEAHSFGLLVATDDAGRMSATHLPLLVRREAGPCGQLVGHVARANPQSATLAGREVMAVFSGPHAYISPAWYEEPNVVPTWNYVAVHAYGRVELVEQEEDVMQVLADYVRIYEANRERPWQFDGDTTYMRGLARHIVAFRIEVARLEGKWKLNQNHSAARRNKVIAQLEHSNNEKDRQIAALMRATLT